MTIATIIRRSAAGTGEVSTSVSSRAGDGPADRGEDHPTSVERGGEWTLQRLALEVAPPAPGAASATIAAAADESGVEIILETEIDALDITVLKDGLDEVGRWALANGFLLSPDAPEVLDFYAERSAQASSSLLADLRSDVGMEWVPSGMWLSYLQLDADAGDLDYDLAVSADPTREPSIVDAGVGPAAVVAVQPPAPSRSWWPLPLGIGLGAIAFVVMTVGSSRRSTSGSPAS